MSTSPTKCLARVRSTSFSLRVLYPNVEHWWEEPDASRWLLGLASYARVVMFDKRGTGMSDRVPDLPGLDQRMDDLRAVMKAADIEGRVVRHVRGRPDDDAVCCDLSAAVSCAGALRLLCPLCNIMGPDKKEQFLDYVEHAWGTGGSLPFFAPSRANDPIFQRWWGRFERLGASPAAAKSLVLMNMQIDISDILSTIRVPTLVIHRTEDVLIKVEGGRYLAQNIPGARYMELPGKDHLPFVGDNADEISDAIEEFLTGSRPPVAVDRVLATVLFTDIVGSTRKSHRARRPPLALPA